MNIIKFGIIGCGMIAGTHAQALNNVDGAMLCGVFDQNEIRAIEFASKYGIRSYNSLKEMLNDNEIEAVCICTPSGLHAEQAIAALSAGKHVVLEKPMALTTADAKRICDQADKSNGLITVISQSRYGDDIERVKALIKDKAFGQLVTCDLYMKFWREPSYYENSPWRGTWLYDGGGALMNQGIHGIDLMNYLFGAPRLLSGRVKTLVHGIEVEDTAAALVEYDCGALGIIEGTTSAYPGFSRRIEINGSKGYAHIVAGKLESLCINGEVLFQGVSVTKNGTESDPTKLNYEGHVKQLTNFINAINKKEPLFVTANDGYAAVKIIEEIYNSSNKN